MTKNTLIPPKTSRTYRRRSAYHQSYHTAYWRPLPYTTWHGL